MNNYIEKHMNEVNQPSKIWRYVDDILIISKMNEDNIKLYVKTLTK